VPRTASLADVNLQEMSGLSHREMPDGETIRRRYLLFLNTQGIDPGSSGAEDDWVVSEQ
jgi:hypothetical protein